MLPLSLLRPILPGLLTTLLVATTSLCCAQQHAPKSIEQLAGANTDRLSDQARARYQFGHHQLRDGDLAGALESFTQVIDEQPDFADGYLSRAQVYRRLERAAPNVEERDRAALGYINDERRITKEANRRFLNNDLKNIFTVSTIALLAIYFTFWLAIVFMFWQNGEQLPLGLLLFFITSLLMLAMPDGPIRYFLFVMGIVVHLVTATSKLRSTKKRNPATVDSLFAANVLDLRMKTVISDPDAFETETKLCPNCSREVSAIAHVCPRCEARF